MPQAIKDFVEADNKYGFKNKYLNNKCRDDKL